MKVKRIIVSAYGCEPGKGSEQGVGWNWVLQLAKLTEVVVITRLNNRKAIEANLPKKFVGRIMFIYYDLPNFILRHKQKQRGLYFYYLLWQWGAYKLARAEIKKRPVSLAMHLTFGSIWLPTFMHRLPVPFIWGPLGGGEAVPFALIASLPFKDRFIQYIRYFLMASLRFNPLIIGLANRSKIIITRTEDTERIIPEYLRFKTRTILETAAEENWFDSPKIQQKVINTETIKAIYTGRLVAFKNLELAIRAVASARARGFDIKFLIVGEGSVKKSLCKLAAEMGISDYVNFVGHQTQKNVFKLLSESDVYLFPSLREGGTWSLMEAMAVGLPSICVQTSGMAVITTPRCAHMIKLATSKEMIETYTQALCDLAEDREARQQMGANARARLECEFRWSQKAIFMASIFEEI